jgi:hypothetical protein
MIMAETSQSPQGSLKNQWERLLERCKAVQHADNGEYRFYFEDQKPAQRLQTFLNANYLHKRTEGGREEVAGERFFLARAPIDRWVSRSVMREFQAEIEDRITAKKVKFLPNDELAELTLGHWFPPASKGVHI